MKLSPCGADCESCNYLKDCGGCCEMEGKPFYIKDFGFEVCPMYDCSVNKKGYKTCASCPELPCRIFHDWKDPNITDEAHINSINERVKVLRDS
ncbi:MAG: DUF3795 domain-containing protein [Synergistaceae bacterium]|nr:DUF3795 domain-containing protein [Synergistaceae bacterium]